MNILAEHAPYATFLQDLFTSKTTLFMGWPSLPPEGHVGEALSNAWRQARKRDVQRTEPLAYALAAKPSDDLCARCFEECGLKVISYNGSQLGERGLEECLHLLAEDVTEDS